MKTLKDLLVACVNATLILVALCLFLLWQLSGTVERVTAEFARNLEVLAPVNARINDLTQEVASLRQDLKEGSATEAVRQQLSELEAQAKELSETLNRISDTPERLMQSSIRTTAESAASALLELRGCEAPANSG